MAEILQAALRKIVERIDLGEQEMSQAMAEIMEGKASELQIAAFLVGLRMKGETIDEITGAARLMLCKATPLPVRSREDLVDIVGTGGDGAGTFNISTATAFVVAGAGFRVAKHGNRSASGRCGSADVMEALGVVIDLSPEAVAASIDEIGIGFLFAPSFHQAMKHAASVRSSLGIRTIFNILGPLTNPANVGRQLLGVYDGALGEIIAQVLGRLGRKHAMVVHGDDGLDEISLSGPTRIWELRNSHLTTWTLHPEDYNIPLRPRDTLRGGNAQENATIIQNLLNGSPGPYRDCILLNAGAAIMVADGATTLRDAICKAAESIDSGCALKKLQQLKEFTHRISIQ